MQADLDDDEADFEDVEDDAEDPEMLEAMVRPRVCIHACAAKTDVEQGPFGLQQIHCILLNCA
jgi:hypothetical protein